MIAATTMLERRYVTRRARIVLRMMMNGAAKTSIGTAANLERSGLRCSSRKLAGRHITSS
jgi:hypothetical protein